jgi:hypothetical protein
MNTFQPIGKQARWRTIYQLLHEASADTLITYDEIAEALTLDPSTDRHAIQMAMRRATQELEREDNRTVDVIPNKGYRIAEPQEHLSLARRHQRKAGRSLARGHSKAIHVDLRGVDPEVRKALEMTAQAFSLQMDFNKRFAVRQAQLEKAVQAITEVQQDDRQRSDDEVAKLLARVERLERRKP